MVSKNINIVFGGGQFGSWTDWSTPEQVEEVLKILEENGVGEIDTSQFYPGSEELLGQCNAASRFRVHTKDEGSLGGGTSAKEEVIARGEASVKKLKTDQVDILYLHAPDRKTPLTSTLAGINELYLAGKFLRFGLSNFRASEVEDVIRIAKEHNYILPTVYQGLYSAITRRQEKELFPTLRKHGMSFYAYSPLASGFLVKTKSQILDTPSGRWDPTTFGGKMFHALYSKPETIAALDKWAQISDESGIGKAELGYRWVAYNSHLRTGDGIIVGASTHNQLRQTLNALRKGPLPDDVASKIEDVWKDLEENAPLDNFNDYLAVE